MNAKKEKPVQRSKPWRLVYCGDERYVLDRAVNAASWMIDALDRLKALEHHKRKEVRHG